MHRVPKLPTMALRGKDTSQQSLCYKVISVPTREGKSLLNLHTAYSVRLPLTQSEQKRSETRVTAECKYTNFYRLAKNLYEMGSKDNSFTLLFSISKPEFWKTFSMCSCTNLCIPAHTGRAQLNIATHVVRQVGLCLPGDTKFYCCNSSQGTILRGKVDFKKAPVLEQKF